MTTKIAVDCMGGDHGPLPIIEGAVGFLSGFTRGEVSITLVGDEVNLRKHLKALNINSDIMLDVQHAPDIVDMKASATEGIRKKTSSIAVAMKMHKEGTVDAVISPGNTGAVMANAVLTLGRLRGVSRPAIAATFPTKLERETLLLDVGANVDIKPENLLQFAQMGASYVEDVLKISDPSVGLLSIGEEPSKGNELVLASHDLLDKGTFKFIGNVEGRDVISGNCNVVVCDGFNGNIILKFAESMKEYLEVKLNRQVSTNIFSKAGSILMGPFLRRLKKAFDSAEYGGAPLLGINGNCVIAHGSSSSKAITNAIKAAYEMTVSEVNEHIKHRIATFRKAVMER